MLKRPLNVHSFVAISVKLNDAINVSNIVSVDYLVQLEFRHMRSPIDGVQTRIRRMRSPEQKACSSNEASFEPSKIVLELLLRYLAARSTEETATE
jgi:hypothetical protein